MRLFFLFFTAPKLVIYDNACSLMDYCMNRDPGFFRNTKFLVDRFHWKNHTGCSPALNISKHETFKKINSEANEQQNALLKKLKPQVSYMNPENFVKTMKLYIWFRNTIKQATIKKLPIS